MLLLPLDRYRQFSRFVGPSSASRCRLTLGGGNSRESSDSSRSKPTPPSPSPSRSSSDMDDSRLSPKRVPVWGCDSAKSKSRAELVDGSGSAGAGGFSSVSSASNNRRPRFPTKRVRTSAMDPSRSSLLLRPAVRSSGSMLVSESMEVFLRLTCPFLDTVGMSFRSTRTLIASAALGSREGAIPSMLASASDLKRDGSFVICSGFAAFVGFAAFADFPGFAACAILGPLLGFADFGSFACIPSVACVACVACIACIASVACAVFMVSVVCGDWSDCVTCVVCVVGIVGGGWAAGVGISICCRPMDVWACTKRCGGGRCTSCCVACDKRCGCAWSKPGGTRRCEACTKRGACMKRCCSIIG
mmetsp:Transcript_14512/g.54824  ORF Transcript_14512/g.54824 Transcript_14512/m.54824 type:complete len:360 (-) Transcript_14512:2390-3469(-)